MLCTIESTVSLLTLLLLLLLLLLLGIERNADDERCRI
jgi:hypothetical protein